MNDEDAVHNSSGIECPHCGRVQTDTWEIDGAFEDEACRETECQKCNRLFGFVTSARFTWKSRKLGSE